MYIEKLPQSPTEVIYKNSLYVPSGQNDVKITVTDELPDLF